ncbi:hypothetical protein LWP59_11145 [Amycolatopsis acidiphila]|uniref:Uncharacterized protein n=1 Tax=Amycolatopsis acidiphila TaxID=715473 RepID=A0A557ZY82_9PSEU|nr:hypothetical protein [Amycolatopsis acidiphila]TVT16963.1 hypothetical protein FNH06_33270 [Amycolatopsis acidiphila]UIJ62131.1 hypothetical protein LWP59_11145 [Amycolatopsis acidiphila]GHG92019.1 hypothetical protein GCM10017788_68620 [Amycolatopsis acidiphila]
MGSGRRDFGEFGAKLEKHLERLPDYAQRAQEKLQRYFPPEGEQNPLRRPAPPRAVTITDVPVFAEARSRWARWNAPEAKLERRKRRASRTLTLWIVLTLLCVLYAVFTGFGLVGAGGLGEAAGGIAGAVVFGALGVRSGLRLRQLNRTELPASSTPPPLPGPNSAARRPMERLAECEASLAELLRQLSESVVPDISVEDARATAAEAASALRALAGRVQAIERARNSAPAGERKALEAAIRTLREQLDDGLDSYGALIAAAGHAVAAGGSGLQPSKDALTDATDRLAGLAIALRELS